MCYGTQNSHYVQFQNCTFLTIGTLAQKLCISENDKPLYSSRYINIVAVLNSRHCPFPILGPYFTALCVKWKHQYPPA